MARGLTQEILAVDAMIGSPHLNAIEAARANPSLKIIDRLAMALGVPVDELLKAPDPGSAPLKSLKPGRKPKGFAAIRRAVQSNPKPNTADDAHDRPDD